jgi:hypothetical protein
MCECVGRLGDVQGAFRHGNPPHAHAPPLLPTTQQQRAMEGPSTLSIPHYITTHNIISYRASHPPVRSGPAAASAHTAAAAPRRHHLPGPLPPGPPAAWPSGPGPPQPRLGGRQHSPAAQPPAACVVVLVRCRGAQQGPGYRRVPLGRRVHRYRYRLHNSVGIKGPVDPPEHIAALYFSPLSTSHPIPQQPLPTHPGATRAAPSTAPSTRPTCSTWSR